MRAGLENCDVTGAVVPPLHLSSTYAFRGFGDKRKYDYSRSGNPTRDLLAEALADLEGGVGAVITGSGMGAITLVGHLLPAGARIVAPHDCYGGTFRLFTAWNKRGELEVDFVDFGNAAAVDAALSKPAAMVWIETPSNPLLRITDIADIARRGHAIGALVVADNTFLSPGWQRPLELGADIVRAFDHQVHQRPQRRGRRRGDRAKTASWPSRSAGGATASASRVPRSTVFSRCAGCARCMCGCANTAAMRRPWPSSSRSTKTREARVLPGLAIASRARHRQAPAVRLRRHRHARSGRAASMARKRFSEALELFSLAESLGGVESLVAHPATMTHAAMAPEARAAAGLVDGLLRLSIGIESADDLLRDLANGVKSLG